MLMVENLCVKCGALTIVDNVSFTLDPGQWLMVVGPNGAGKSTMINAVAKSVQYTGRIELKDRDIRKIKPQHFAREIGVLMQNNSSEYSFSVEEVVRLGRYAHARGLFAPPSPEDEKAVEEALTRTGMAAMRNQSVLTLSGGELQRTFLAQILAQNPGIMILDEPTNHLDLLYQKQMFSLVSDWIKQPGRAVISVVHDLNLAKAYATHALLMNKCKTVAYGRADDVMTRENLKDVYDIDVFDWMKSLLLQWQ